MFEQIAILPILIFSVVLHEVAHGWMALRLGDPTARDLGRLTLNPLPHIDPVGSVIVPLLSLAASGRVFLAWAKPVPVNHAYFANPRRDDILVSVIGPLSNIAIALVCSVFVIALNAIILRGHYEQGIVLDMVLFLNNMFAAGISLNVVLAVFNLIPVPPLDGSHVVASLLPPALSARYRSVGFFGIFALILLMRFQPVGSAFSAAVDSLTYPFYQLIALFR